MNQSQATDILQSMINFIQQHGREKVDEINGQAESDFLVDREKTIEAEKKRLDEQFTKDINIAEVNLKIERSAELNKTRISKMRRTNELVESLQLAAKKQLAEKIAEDNDAYAELLKNLLVQGLIKLIEPTVTLRVRESDKDLIEGLIDDAIAEYKELMLAQVKALEGKDDIPCKVLIDENNWLPEWNEEDPAHSCLGGFVMYCRKNRIVCSQTIDDRLALTYQQCIPEMRASLFPSLTSKK